MKPVTRMLLMRGNRREDNDRHDYGRHMYDDREKDYEPYDTPHDAFRDRRGRRHYDSGKYAPMRSAYDDMMSYDYDRRYTHDLPQNRRYPMGFTAGDETDHHESYPLPMRGQYEGQGYIRRSGDGYQIGGSVHQKDENYDKKFDRKTAEKWVSQMSKPGKAGEKGGKWTYDEAKSILEKKGWNINPVEFFAVLNMIYSDYGKTLANYNINNTDLYADLAKDWIMDDDVAAGAEKTACYYYDIVE